MAFVRLVMFYYWLLGVLFLCCVAVDASSWPSFSSDGTNSISFGFRQMHTESQGLKFCCLGVGFQGEKNKLLAQVVFHFGVYTGSKVFDNVIHGGWQCCLNRSLP